MYVCVYIYLFFFLGIFYVFKINSNYQNLLKLIWNQRNFFNKKIYILLPTHWGHAWECLHHVHCPHAVLPYGNSENKIALPEFATVLMAFFHIYIILFIIFPTLCELMMNTDDAMAIFVALRSPEVEVIGLTTIYGNVYTTLATRNALHLV